MGWMWAALHAGVQQAMSAVNRTSAGAAMNVHGSYGRTPYRVLLMKRTKASAAAMPVASSKNTSRRPWRTTKPMTRARVAAECHASPDLGDALAHRKVEDSVETYERKEKCHSAECGQQSGLKAPARGGGSDSLLHGVDVGERDGWID